MIKALFSLSMLLFVAVDAHAQIAACTSVTELPDSDFIYKNSAPLRAGGPGTPLVGYRKEPTLIMEKKLTRSSTKIYDSEGTQIGRCPWASAHGAAGGRFRCTKKTASIRRAAVKNTGSPTIFFTTKGTNCVEVPDAGKCYGSSKGLCNQTIK